MSTKFSVLLLLVLGFALSQTSYAKASAETAARKALSADVSESAPAIAELRSLGPAGLAVLFEMNAAEINQHISDPFAPSSPEWRRLTTALDAVSQQKDSYVAGLYWYTDLAQAKAAAKASGKPILSLRLLGKLNEEFSCANSRFFRTVLYANADVSKALGDRFILHWQSVRPAPRVTIDFGDGRKLERTVTGNSIHYVLDSDGHPIDALPGLYGPAAFLRLLTQAEEVFGRLKGMDSASRLQALDVYHRAAVRTITTNWLADTKSAGGKIPEYLLPNTSGSPRAVDIAPLAVTKMVTEVSILRAITKDADALGAVTDEPTWTRIAHQHIGEARLDDLSISLIQRQTQNLLVANAAGLAPGLKLTDLIQKFQLSIALDTVRNEYVLHTKLHAWLIADPRRDDVAALNEKVYSELFLTPKSDPWLGLFSPDTYTALENGGVVQ